MGFTDWWDYSLWGAKRNGKNDGSCNIPGKTQKDHAAYERQLALRANKEIQGIAIEWENMDRTLKGDYVAALRKCIKARESAKKEREEATAASEKDNEALEEIIINSQHPHLRPIVYRVVFGIIALVEIPLTTKAFELLGDNQQLALVIALGICIAVPFLAHFSGIFLKENFNRKGLILSTDAVVLLCTMGFLAWLRQKYVEAASKEIAVVQLDSKLLTCAFFAIQLLLFVTATTASYLAHDGHPDRPISVKRGMKTKRDNEKETREAIEADKVLEAREESYTQIDAEREKTFSTYRIRAEGLIEDCKLRIEAYRGANIRARGDEDIASFSTYPEMPLPACLQILDKEYGFSVPGASPVKCSFCGESSPFTATTCIHCGESLGK